MPKSMIGAIAIVLSLPCLAQDKAAPLNLDVLVAAVDSDRDGCMSHREWQAAGLPESSYEGLKDDKGCVTLAKLQATKPPDGIDLNGDGTLTVEEFRAFDKKMQLRRPPPPDKADSGAR